MISSEAPEKLLVCDSGLGGLDVASRLLPHLRRPTRIICFNAWPDERFGYNQLPDLREKVRIYECAFRGMLEFAPDRIVIGCNTLSIVHRYSAFFAAPPCEVADITGTAVEAMEKLLAKRPELSLILLGTVTTIGSGFYQKALFRRNLPPERIVPLPCPGLASRIENDPDSAAVEEQISEIARQVPRGMRCGAALCCTHFGYARTGWENLLKPEAIVNPNETLYHALDFPGADPAPEVTVEVHSRVMLPPSKRAALAPRLDPRVAEALEHYRYNPELFQF